MTSKLNGSATVSIEKYTFTELSSDLARVRINVYHNSYNPNGSFFEDSCFTNSSESFKNKPICASYVYDDDSTKLSSEAETFSDLASVFKKDQCIGICIDCCHIYNIINTLYFSLFSAQQYFFYEPSIYQYYIY